MNFMFRLAQFMRGRRGWDRFGFFLMVVSFIVELVGNILRMPYVYYAGLLIFFYCLFRMMSRNIPARERENARYLNITNRFRNWRFFRQQRKEQKQQRKNNVYQYSQHASNGQAASEKKYTDPNIVYAYYCCPSCKQQVRIPAGKGTVNITCPRCGEKFEATS